MPKYDVYASVAGTKYIGRFEAATADEAEELAWSGPNIGVCLCHQCEAECDGAEVSELFVEEVEELA